MGWREVIIQTVWDYTGCTDARAETTCAGIEDRLAEMPPADRIALARELLKGTDQDLCRRGMTLAECVSEFHRRAEHQPCPIPRRRAVEAACVALSSAVGCDEPECGACQQAGKDAITAYERAMADAGWRMVRVPEKKDPATTLHISNEALAQDRNPSEVRRRMVADANWAAGNVEGWNACRAKMLEDEG